MQGGGQSLVGWKESPGGHLSTRASVVIVGYHQSTKWVEKAEVSIDKTVIRQGIFVEKSSRRKRISSIRTIREGGGNWVSRKSRRHKRGGHPPLHDAKKKNNLS